MGRVKASMHARGVVHAAPGRPHRWWLVLLLPLLLAVLDGVALVASAASVEPVAAAAAAAAAGQPAEAAAASPASATPQGATQPARVPERTLKEVLPGLWVGGEVPVEQMPGWPGGTAGQGGRKLFTIIDLRPSGESPLVGPERAAAAAAGVGYLSIPVLRNSAPPAAGVGQLEAVLRNAEGAPVVLHCVSGNRAGDLLARYLIRTGMDVDSAIARGREVGLTPQREASIREGALGHP